MCANGKAKGEGWRLAKEMHAGRLLSRPDPEWERAGSELWQAGEGQVPGKPGLGPDPPVDSLQPHGARKYKQVIRVRHPTQMLAPGHSGGHVPPRSAELPVTTERPSVVCTVQTAGLRSPLRFTTLRVAHGHPVGSMVLASAASI